MKNEAKILASRLAFRPEIVEKWMEANSIDSILDLKDRYPGKEHNECMKLVADEIWAFGKA